MSSICIDTHLVIWGVRECASEEQQDMIPRTKAFFEYCRDKGTSILIPSVVVGEVLTAVEPKHHPMILNLLKGSFQIPPYDAQASAVFAKLWRESKESGLAKELQNELQATRQELKADCLIVATAIAKKAEAIYTHDDKLKKFANGHIDIRDVPHYQVQTALALVT